MADVFIVNQVACAIVKRKGKSADGIYRAFHFIKQSNRGLSVTKLIGYVVQCRIDILFGKGRQIV